MCSSPFGRQVVCIKQGTLYLTSIWTEHVSLLLDLQRITGVLVCVHRPEFEILEN
jgi:hypothetical protein